MIFDNWSFFWGLFLAVEEVAGVAEAGYDVTVRIEDVVDVACPNGGFNAFGEGFLYVFNSLVGGDDHCDVDVLGSAFLQKSLDCNLHRTACGKHWVGYHEHFVFNAWTCQIFGVNLKLVAVVDILAVG